MVHLGGLRAEADELDAIVVAVPDNLPFPCLNTLKAKSGFLSSFWGCPILCDAQAYYFDPVDIVIPSCSCCLTPFSISETLSKIQGRQTSSLKVAQHMPVPLTLLDVMQAYAGLYASCASRRPRYSNASTSLSQLCATLWPSMLLRLLNGHTAAVMFEAIRHKVQYIYLWVDDKLQRLLHALGNVIEAHQDLLHCHRPCLCIHSCMSPAHRMHCWLAELCNAVTCQCTGTALRCPWGHPPCRCLSWEAIMPNFGP